MYLKTFCLLHNLKVRWRTRKLKCKATQDTQAKCFLRLCFRLGIIQNVILITPLLFTRFLISEDIEHAAVFCSLPSCIVFLNITEGSLFDSDHVYGVVTRLHRLNCYLVVHTHSVWPHKCVLVLGTKVCCAWCGSWKQDVGELALMIVVQNITAVMCRIKASFTDIDLFRKSKVCIWPEQLDGFTLGRFSSRQIGFLSVLKVS